MIKNLFNKITGNSILAKAFKEYSTIVELESKRLEMQKEFGKEIPDLKIQQDIIRNNFITLAHVYASIENNSVIKKRSGVEEYFNMQGTPSVITKLDVVGEKYSHKATSTVTDVIPIVELESKKEDIIALEKKFHTLDKRKLKPAVAKIVEKKTNDKMEQKIVELSKLFKGNEQVIEDFILRDMKDEEINFNNLTNIIHRLDFVSYLLHNNRFNIKSSEAFATRNKDLLLLDFDKFNIPVKVMNIELFFNSLDQLKYDIILKNHP